MKTRSYSHRRKVILWVQIILANVLLIATLWWMDAQDIHWIKDEWIAWVKDLHFLLRISVWMLYIIVVWKLIGWWYNVCGWFSRHLVYLFYR